MESSTKREQEKRAQRGFATTELAIVLSVLTPCVALFIQVVAPDFG